MQPFRGECRCLGATWVDDDRSGGQDTRPFGDPPAKPSPIRETLDALLATQKAQDARPFYHAVPVSSDNRPNLEHAWLLGQLAALDTCQGVIAVGGKSDGAANDGAE